MLLNAGKYEKEGGEIAIANVFVVNKSIHDYSNAERYGDIVYLSHGDMRRFSTSRAYRKFIRVLKQSSPDDYLLLSGLPMLCVVAAFILALKHKRLNLLLFNPDNGKKEYLERIIIGE